jgi:hypothetical protein
MQAYFALATFTTSPVVITSLTFKNSAGATVAAPTQATRIRVEPASGSNVSFVEVLGLATGATGGTDGVIHQLAAYSATGPLDSWEIVAQKGGNLISVGEFQLDGTSTEKVRVTVWVS